ncbi:Ig-like domain-containing protein [Bacillus massilinigeriensis]|uniref:Ig-like domain-containing protein n=1 Tax=Bacillus mediterraneensis TaxID=1805474 RepID=UPI0008F8E3DD|nr:Ig-like domain-containing protein [Bacillus mediterraneensis]
MQKFLKVMSGAALALSVMAMPLAANASENGEKSLNVSSKGKYVLISNESISPEKQESSGTLHASSTKFNTVPGQPKGMYKRDYIKPFEVPKNGEGRIDGSKAKKQAVYTVGNAKRFYVSNIFMNTTVSLPFKLYYQGKKANVWVHSNQISEAEAIKLGKEFDAKIYPSVANNFGVESDVDGDKRINILCYDIQDGFNGANDFVAGYFYAGDLFRIPQSNESEVFHIDTFPLMQTDRGRDVSAAYTTLAHEFQHMVNFNRNIFMENAEEQMDTWLDEAFAMAAEQIYSGKVLHERIDYYNNSDSIARGQSLLYWDEDGDVLANYSLSYLFGQYIMLQSNKGNAIFKEMLNDKRNDYKAVENALKIPFGSLMTNFRLAMQRKDATGPYGFKGKPEFNALKTKPYTGGTVNLRGGGAILKFVSTDFTVPANAGPTVTYTDSTSAGVLQSPIANTVGDSDKQVSGKAAAGASVHIKANGKLLGKAVARTDGTFKLAITPQKAGTVLQIHSVKGANKSVERRVRVLDKTPPAKVAINTVKDDDKVISGKTEPGATVSVYKGKTRLGYAAADRYGNYSVAMKTTQKAGTVLSVYAKDKAGNENRNATVKVIDKTAPARPSVYSLKTSSSYVKGKAEPYSTVYVKIKGKVVSKKTLKSSNAFSVKIPRQRVNTVVYVYAKDRAGNTSKSAKVTVKK